MHWVHCFLGCQESPLHYFLGFQVVHLPLCCHGLIALLFFLFFVGLVASCIDFFYCFVFFGICGPILVLLFVFVALFFDAIFVPIFYIAISIYVYELFFDFFLMFYVVGSYFAIQLYYGVSTWEIELFMLIGAPLCICAIYIFLMSFFFIFIDPYKSTSRVYGPLTSLCRLLSLTTFFFFDN